MQHRLILGDAFKIDLFVFYACVLCAIELWLRHFNL